MTFRSALVTTGLLAAAWLLSACTPATPPAALDGVRAAGAVSAPPPGSAMPSPLRIFYSGHSLMDRPLPDHVEALAQAEGREVQWERQYRVGSLLRERTRGLDASSASWSGWTLGDNRQGSGLDVAAALSGRIPALPPFDVLVVTERHDILWAMQNESTAGYLRRLHDERVRGRPEGATWFYESWQSMSADRIADWARYETAAAIGWQCAAAEVNRSLQAEGRADRVQSLPAARALVRLVERATSPTGWPGVTAATPQATVERLFSDAVHLTDAGMYYMALVTWAFVNGAPATRVDLPVPKGMDPALAAGLRSAAADAHAALRDQTLSEASAEACQARLAEVCPIVWPYMAQRWQSEGRAWPQARWQQFKLQRQCEAGVRDGRHRLVAASG